MIPRIVEYIEFEEYTGVVMDYLEGCSLSAICQSGCFFSMKQTLQLGVDLCAILEYLHEQNPPIVYRDLKPQNLMFTKEGQLKLIDFDCACFLDGSERKEFAGTKGYAAPEQYEGKYSAAADIYAVGVTLETICKKGKPFRVRKIFKKCRNRKPEKRYRSAKELKTELQKCLEAVSDRSRKWKLLIAVTGVLFLLPALWLLVLTGSEAACLDAVRQGRFEDAAALFPEREDIYLAMLQSGMEQGETEEVIATIQQFQQMYPEETRNHNTVKMKIGRLYIQGNVLDDSFYTDYEKARDWYGSITQKSDPEIDWSLELLDILTRSEHEISWKYAAEAMEHLHTTLQKEADVKSRSIMCEILASVWMTNRYYLEAWGKEPINESIRLLEEACFLMQENDNLQNLSRRLSLAHAYYLDGILHKNEESLEKSLELYQDIETEQLLLSNMQQKILLKTAYLYEELEKYENAELTYQRLIEEDPQELEYICSYALMELLHCSDEKKARELFETASHLPEADKNQNYQILKERLEGLG